MTLRIVVDFHEGADPAEVEALAAMWHHPRAFIAGAKEVRVEDTAEQRRFTSEQIWSVVECVGSEPEGFPLVEDDREPGVFYHPENTEWVLADE